VLKYFKVNSIVGDVVNSQSLGVNTFFRNNMDNEDISEAKEMYFNNKCNRFYMWKEGKLDYYDKFNISKKIEKYWGNEYKLKLIKDVENDDFKDEQFILHFSDLIEYIKNSKDLKIFAHLINFIKTNISQINLSALMRVTEEIIRFRNSFLWKRRKILNESKNLGIQILNTIIENSSKIDSSFRGYVPIEDNVINQQLMQEYIIERCKNNIKILKK